MALEARAFPEPGARPGRRVDQRGIDAGAAGGKLVGAGGGGFLLFYAEDKTDLRFAMRAGPRR